MLPPPTTHREWRQEQGDDDAGQDGVEEAGWLRSRVALCQGQLSEGWRQRGELKPTAFPLARTLLGFMESVGWRLGCLPA